MTFEDRFAEWLKRTRCIPLTQTKAGFIAQSLPPSRLMGPIPNPTLALSLCPATNMFFTCSKPITLCYFSG